MMTIPIVMMDDGGCDDSTNGSAIREIVKLKPGRGSG
jgi:hypothetical protein